MSSDDSIPDGLREVRELFLAETTELRERTVLLEKRVESVDSRLRDRYVRITGLNANVVPKGKDWLASIRSAMVGLGVCVDDSESNTSVLRVDLAGSNPKAGVFVVEVTDNLKSKLLTPNKSLRVKFNKFNEENGSKIKFWSFLTASENDLRIKTSFYVRKFIEYCKSKGDSSNLIKVPVTGPKDRVLLEPVDRTKGKRTFITYAEVATRMGTTVEVLDKEFEADLSKRRSNGDNFVSRDGKRRTVDQVASTSKKPRRG